MGFIPAYLICASQSQHDDTYKNKMYKIVKYFGLAFQISDDFEDIEQDQLRVKTDYNPNLICKFGKDTAYEIYTDALKQFKKLSHEVQINHIIFDELCDFLDNRVLNTYEELE